MVADLLERLREELADRYAIERELGRGGMAAVYLARDLKHLRHVAIKVLKPEIAALSGSDRFHREIRVTSGLTHPHILPLLDSGQAGGLPYFVTPYVEGESLARRLEREKQLPIDDAIRIAREVADALDTAHSHGIVHRDIKPANILLEAGHAVVADFGIGLALSEAGDARSTTMGVSLGTPGYMSPEQALGTAELDGRCDLYALGCVLFEMLTGQRPFQGPTPQAVISNQIARPPPLASVYRASIPASVDAAIHRALARSPADRFQSAREFSEALDQPVGTESQGKSIRPRVRRPSVKRTRWPSAIRRHPVRVGLGFAVLAATGLLWFNIRPPDSSIVYSGIPSWSAWEFVEGDPIRVAAATRGSLVFNVAGSDSVYVYDGAWQAFAIPDSFELRPWMGALPAAGLFALWHRETRAGEQTPLARLTLSDRGVAFGEQLTERPFREADLWSDGRDVVAWGPYPPERLEENRFESEFFERTGQIRQLWGPDYTHRFAIADARPDSLMVFGPTGWQSEYVLPPGQTGASNLAGGATFPDGSTVVFGELCEDQSRCRMLVLQQDTFDAAWRRVMFAAGAGEPIPQPASTVECVQDRFGLTGASGISRTDYYVWGDWTPCGGGYGCPEGQPCIWHFSQGELRPVHDLRGNVITNVLPAAGTAWALTQNGGLWRRVWNGWDMVDRIPGLPARRIAASSVVVAESEGGKTKYRAAGTPPRGSGWLHELPPGVSPDGPPLEITAAGSYIALLPTNRDVLESRCGMEREFVMGADSVFTCSAWAALRVPAGSGEIAAIEVLASGEVLAASRSGRIVSWADGRVSRIPRLPTEARGDSLWGVEAVADGTVLAIGRRNLLQRDTLGEWRVIRRFDEDLVATHFAVLPGGSFVVAGPGVRVFGPEPDSEPLLLYPFQRDGNRISALHVLPHGRLVAGFEDPDWRAVAGRLEIWSNPSVSPLSDAVTLPMAIDITGLEDDGQRLLVVGRGGSMTIPLDSLAGSDGNRSR